METKRRLINGVCPILLALAFLLLGCEQPEVGPEPSEAQIFTATLPAGEATKTVLAGTANNERNVMWQDNDLVRIIGATQADYRATNLSAERTSATLVPAANGSAVNQKNASGYYEAFYPASLYRIEDGKCIFPSEHTYIPVATADGNRVVATHLPMYARSTTSALTFHNLCAVLNFKLTSVDADKVTRIEVTSENNWLSGPFSLSWSDNAPVLAMTGGQGSSKTVTLDCSAVSGGGVQLKPQAATEFCIPLPAAVYPENDLTVTIYYGTGGVLFFKNENAGSAGTEIKRSHIHETVKVIGKTMQFAIQSDADNRTLLLPFRNTTLPAELTVMWGDGNSNVYPAGTAANTIQHTYTSSRDGLETIVSIVGTSMPPMTLNIENTITHPFKKLLRKVLTPLLPYSDNSMFGKRAYACFGQCINLTEIPADLFVNNPDIKWFENTFEGCTSLRRIPGDLFAPVIGAETFSGVFSGCSELTYIPDDLFNHESMKSVKYFDFVFNGCSKLPEIPPELFYKMENVIEMQYVFWYCTGLNEIPPHLFDKNKKVETFNYVFSECTTLTSIPEELFFENEEVKVFSAAFKGCSNVQFIPELLFSKNKKAELFEGTFMGCSKIEYIPELLFVENVKATSFGAVFADCINLKEIPDNLFKTNLEVLTFSSAFEECKSLTFIPSVLFKENKKVNDYSSTFAYCDNLQSIPTGLFDQNTEVTSFSRTFKNCSSLKTVPVDLFANNTAVNSFFATFYRCGQWTGTAPALWQTHPSADGRGCFTYCGGVTNYTTIPDPWKDVIQYE